MEPFLPNVAFGRICLCFTLLVKLSVCFYRVFVWESSVRTFISNISLIHHFLEGNFLFEIWPKHTNLRSTSTRQRRFFRDYMRIFLHTYLYTHSRIYTHTHTHIHTHIYTHIHTYTHTYTHTHTHTHTYTHSHTYTHIHTLTHSHMCRNVLLFDGLIKSSDFIW